MIEHNWFCEHRVLQVCPRGPLQKEDFLALAGQVDPVIAGRGHLAGVLIEAADFPGWEDFTALISHFRFIRDHHARIHKVAVVSDQTLLGFMPRLMDHFVGAEVRPFMCADRSRALDWLCEAG